MKQIHFSRFSFQTQKISDFLIQITSSLCLCLLYLLANGLFIDSVFAEMSDKEKVEFIESLAEPLKEKKVFYRWQSETARKNLIEAGEMTPQLYKHFMSHREGNVGGGLYIAEDVVSSSGYGRTLMQVEIEAGYRFLNLQDPKIQKKLKKKGITNTDVFKSKARVAVKDIVTGKRSWWALKKQEGVRFKPFSGRGINLNTLTKGYNNLQRDAQREFFINSVREDILKRAETNSFIFESPFVKIVEEVHGREYVKDAVNRHITSRPSIETFAEGVKIFQNVGEYLSEANQNRIVNKALPHIRNSLDAGSFLQINAGHLSDEAIMKIVNKTVPKFYLVNAAADFLERSKSFLPKNYITTIVKNTLKHFKTTQEITDFLERTGAYLSKSDRNRLMKQALSFINSEGELKAFQKILPEEEYNETLKKFQNSQKNMVNRTTERLRCLKRWLSIP